MDALTIPWRVVERVRATQAVVTGESAAEVEKVELPRFGYLDRPAVVLVGDPEGDAEACEELLSTLFKTEKICSGMRACRPLRISAENAAADPSLAGEGKTVPRVLVLDPVREKVKVLEKSRLKATTLFKEMARASRPVWEEKLEKTVKSHLKLLTERDRLHDLAKVAREAEQRAEEDEARAEAQARVAELEAQLVSLREQEKHIWELTRKWQAPVDPDPPPPEPVLPAGWRVVRRTGQPPYYVRPDGTTTWDPPEGSKQG